MCVCVGGGEFKRITRTPSKSTSAQTMLQICFSVCLPAFSPPGSPQNVSLLADNRNIAVSWEPPTETYGNIRRYIVTWAILPDFQDVPTKVIVNGDVTMAFIVINNDVGRMFRIRVRGENKYGVGDYSIPRYIRIGNNILSPFIYFLLKFLSTL